jgi:long-chain acyl-CoA synthetase
MQSISTIIEQAASVWSQKPALIFKGEQVSFERLRDEAHRLAGGLKAMGVSKGDRVAIYLPNCPEFAYGYLATFLVGAVGVPLDFMLKSDELISCLTHAQAKLLIAQPRNDIDLAQIKRAVSSLERIIVVRSPSGGDVDAYQDVVAKADRVLGPVAIGEDDPALIMYTSGTTGAPKGILLNYKHLEGSPKAMHDFVALKENDVKLAAIPLSHIGGFIYLQNCIHFGITVILMDRFNPFEFLSLVQTHRVTCFHIVPPMYTAILTLKEIERFDLTSLKWVVVFGAPSSPEIMERFHRFCPKAKLLNGWGMTETCPPNTVTPFTSDNIASVGKPSSLCRIRIVDEAGSEVPAGEIGEITISGPYLMAGYYKDEAATRETIKNGWLYTGDLGRFDKQGFLYIVGRKKEMIKVGGQIVYAPEVEAALYKNEAVAECAVVGMPDKMKGEAVKAFVVLKAGARASVEELRYFLRDHLANFKVPSEVELRLELPKNRTGKIDKNLLKQEALT